MSAHSTTGSRSLRHLELASGSQSRSAWNPPGVPGLALPSRKQNRSAFGTNECIDGRIPNLRSSMGVRKLQRYVERQRRNVSMLGRMKSHVGQGLQRCASTPYMAFGDPSTPHELRFFPGTMPHFVGWRAAPAGLLTLLIVGQVTSLSLRGRWRLVRV